MVDTVLEVMSLYPWCVNISVSLSVIQRYIWMRRCTCYDSKRTGAVHGAASVGLVSPGAAVQVQWSSDILSVQFVRRVGFSRAVPSQDGVGEGSEVRVAVERGYRVLKILKFYEYKVTQY